MTSKSPYQLYCQSLAHHWPAYLVGTVAMFLTSGSEAMAPKFIQWTIDLLTFREKAVSHLPALFQYGSITMTLRLLVLGLAAVLVVGWFGRLGWRHTLARRTHEEAFSYKNQFWDTLRYQPLNFFHKYPLGDLMNRGISDINRVRAIHGFSLVLTYDVIFFTLIAVTSMLMIDWQLTLLTFVALPFLPRPMTKISRQEYSQHISSQSKLSDLSDLIAQALGTIRLTRATAGEQMWQGNLADQADGYAKTRFNVIRTGFKIYPLSMVSTLVAYVVLLTYGIYKVRLGQLTIGEFVALQSYVLLLQVPLAELGDLFAEWQTGFASFERLVEILNFRRTPPAEEQLEAKTAPAVVPSAESCWALLIQELSFSYADAKQPALSRINLALAPGGRLGITGPIGSGKSTLLRAICGLLDHPQGTISLMGEQLAGGNHKMATKHITLVPQKTFLFAGSIRDNLVLDGAFSDDQLWEALTIVHIHDEILAFDGALDAWIGEGGINLSGGQKQRIALARAILRDTPILLLDDCLSAVDALTEDKILEAFAARFSHRTIVWVAHRLSTLALCPEICHMHEGRIVRTQAADRGQP